MKRLKLKHYILAGISVRISYACKKSFLNIAPVGVLNPSIVANLAGVQGLLVGAYATLDGYPGNTGTGWGSAILTGHMEALLRMMLIKDLP